MTRPAVLVLSLFLSLVLASGAHAQEWAFSPARIDSVVERVMREFRVPGVSVAIVKEGAALLTKG